MIFTVEIQVLKRQQKEKPHASWFNDWKIFFNVLPSG